MESPHRALFPPDTAIIVAVSGTDAGRPLARSLARLGARVVLLSDSASDADSSFTRIPVAFTSRGNVAAGFETAQQQSGPARIVVHSATPGLSLKSAPIGNLSFEQWSAATHSAVKATIYCLQAAHDCFAARSGSMVVFGPALSLVGAPGLVALSMALEAQRALVKAAARQWGRKGIRINWVAVGEAGNYPELQSAAIPEVPEPGPPPLPLGYVPAIGSDLAPLIGLLSCEAARTASGATLNIDGGRWMMP